MLIRLIAGVVLALAVAGAAAARPLVVILTDPSGTVAPDLMTPYAILAESGAVEVKVLSTDTRPVRLTPGMAWVAPEMTLAELARRPKGPDVVIVPAMRDETDPVRAAWLRGQLRSGARIMSICNGARVLAAAGLLDGRQATVHWHSRKAMARHHPQVTWRRDLRWVEDGPITTTAGISAGEPASLNLLRELAGEAVMRATARRLGLAAPDLRHRGDDYRLTGEGMGLVVGNTLALWGHEDVAVPLEAGFDERAFGDALDAWSRTYRSTAWATGPASAVSRRGLVVYRARALPARFDRTVTPAGPEATFAQIDRAYGERTARFVALQFEHPYGAVSRW
jgi:putative intracellular protease/amidase